MENLAEEVVNKFNNPDGDEDENEDADREAEEGNGNFGNDADHAQREHDHDSNHDPAENLGQVGHRRGGKVRKGQGP